jgi:hypothetical protein
MVARGPAAVSPSWAAMAAVVVIRFWFDIGVIAVVQEAPGV